MRCPARRNPIGFVGASSNAAVVSGPRQRRFSRLPPSLRGFPTASRRVRVPHFQIDQTNDGGRSRSAFAVQRWRYSGVVVQSAFTRKWEPWRAGGDWSSAKNPRCRGEYHAEDFDGAGCGNGYRRSGSGDVGPGAGAVAWRLARWMGLGSRPVHRRTCCRRPDRGRSGGTLLLPVPAGYYAGYYAPPPYGGPCVWRRVWNGYAWVRACV